MGRANVGLEEVSPQRIETMIVQIACEYFTRYGDSGRLGTCAEPATLALVDSSIRPEICVCRTHADRIVSRFPLLGDVEQRFTMIVIGNRYL